MGRVGILVEQHIVNYKLLILKTSRFYVDTDTSCVTIAGISLVIPVLTLTQAVSLLQVSLL